MDEKLRLLWETVGEDYSLGTFEEFRHQMTDEAKRKAFHLETSSTYALGTYKQFNQEYQSSTVDERRNSVNPNLTNERERNPLMAFGKQALQTIGYNLPAAGAAATSASLSSIRSGVRGSVEHNKAIFDVLNYGHGLNERAIKELNDIDMMSERLTKGLQLGELQQEEYNSEMERLMKRKDFLAKSGFATRAPDDPVMVMQKELLIWAAERQEKGGKITEDQITSLQQIEDPYDAMMWVANALGQAVGQIPLSVATFGASGAIQEVGEIYMEGVRHIAEANGITPMEVIERGMDEPATAAAYGLAAGALEYVGAKGALSGMTKKGFGKTLARRSKEIFKAGRGEFLTEGAQTILEQAGAQTSVKGKSVFDVEIDWMEVLEAAAQGAVGGSGMHIGGKIGGRLFGRGKKDPDTGLPIDGSNDANELAGQEKFFRRDDTTEEFEDALEVQQEELVGMQALLDEQGNPETAEVVADIEDMQDEGGQYFEDQTEEATNTDKLVKGLMQTIKDVETKDLEAEADAQALLALKDLEKDREAGFAALVRDTKKETSRINKESKALLRDETKATKLQAAEVKQDLVAEQKRKTALAKEAAKNKAAEKLSATRQVKEFEERKKAKAKEDKIIDKAAADMVKNVKKQKEKDEKAQQLSQAKKQKAEKLKISEAKKKSIADTKKAKAKLIVDNTAKVRSLNDLLKKKNKHKEGEYTINLKTGEISFHEAKKKAPTKKAPAKPAPKKKMTKAAVTAIVEKYTPAWLRKVAKNPNHPYHKVAKEIKEKQTTKELGSRSLATIRNYAKNKSHPQHQEAVDYLATREEKKAVKEKEEAAKKKATDDTEFRHNQEENAAKALAKILYEKSQKVPNKERIDELTKKVNKYKSLIMERFSEKDTKGLSNFGAKQGQVSNVVKRSETIFQEEKAKRKNKLKEEKQTPAQKKEVDRTERATVLETGVKMAKAILEHKRDNPKDKKGLKQLEEGIRLVEKRYKELIGNNQDPNFRKAKGRVGDGSVWLRAKRLFEADEKALKEEKAQEIPEKLEMSQSTLKAYDNFRERGLNHDQAITLAKDNRQIPEDMRPGEIQVIVDEIKKENKAAEKAASIEQQKSDIKEVLPDATKFEEIDLEEDTWDENDMELYGDIRHQYAGDPNFEGTIVTTPISIQEVHEILGENVSKIVDAMLNIVNAIRTAHNQPKVTFHGAMRMPHVGNFHYRTGRITINMSDRYTRRGEINETITHEILHPFTMLLAKVADTTSKKWTKGTIWHTSKFTNRVEGLLKEARDKWEEYSLYGTNKEGWPMLEARSEYTSLEGYQTTAPYGLTSADEFLSEAGSNPRFMMFLNSIDAKPTNERKSEGRSLFTKLIHEVIEFYNNIMGIDGEFKMRETSILRKLAKAVEAQEEALIEMSKEGVPKFNKSTAQFVSGGTVLADTELFGAKMSKKNKIREAIAKHFVDGKIAIKKADFIKVLNKLNTKLEKKQQITPKEAEVIYNSIIEQTVGKGASVIERKLFNALDTSKMTGKSSKGVTVGKKVFMEAKDLLNDIADRLTGKVSYDQYAYITRLQGQLEDAETAQEELSEAMERENFLQEFQDFHNKPLARQKQLLEIVEKTLKTSKDQFKAEQRRKRAQNAKIVSEGINETGPKKTNHVRFVSGGIYKKGTIIEHKGRLYKVQENMTEGLPKPTGTKSTPFFKHIGSLTDESKPMKQSVIGKWLGTDLLNFSYLLEHVSSLQDFTSELLRSALGQRHSRAVFKSELQEQTGMHDALERIVAKKYEIMKKYNLGNTWKAIEKWTKKGKQMIELNKDKHSEVLKLSSTSKSMSPNQALHHLMASYGNLNDAAYKEHQIDKKELQKQLVSLLPLGYLDWGSFLLHDLYPSYYKKVNPHFIEEFNMSMPERDSYVPNQREIDPQNKDNRVTPNTFGNSLSIMSNSLKDIQKGSKSLPRTQDSDEVLLRYISEMEHFMAWRTTLKNMRTVFRDPSVMSMIRTYHGKEIVSSIHKAISNFSQDKTQTDLRNGLLDKIRRAYSYTTLGMNPSLITKQAISFIQYSQDVPFFEYGKSLAYLITHPAEWKTLAREIYDSPHAKTRFRVGETFDMEAVLTQEINSYGARRSEMSHFTMAPSRIGDIIATIVGGAVSYRINKAKYGQEEALMRWHEMTTLRQQSALKSNQGSIDRTSWGKLAHQFASNPAANMRNLHSNTRIFVSALRYARRTGKPTSWVLKQPKVKRAFRSIITTNIVFNAAFAALTEGIASWGDDDEFDWSQFGIDMAAGTVTGIPWVGRIATWVAQTMMTNNRYQFKPIPAYSQAQDFVFLMESIKDWSAEEQSLTQEDYRKAIKAANLLLSYKFGAMPFYGLYDTFVYRGWQKADVKSMIFHTPVETEGEMKTKRKARFDRKGPTRKAPARKRFKRN